MARRLGRGWGSAALALLLLVGPSEARARQGNPGRTGGGTLTLEEVLALARGGNPRIRAAAYMVGVVEAREAGAGVLPDPMLEVGVMNLSLPGLSANMPASMAPAIRLVQHLPLPSKRSLAREVARSVTLGEQAAGEEVWWEVRSEAAGAFYRLYDLDRRGESMESTLRLLQEFEAIARSMYAAGTGRQADVLRAGLEVARMEGEIHRLDALRSGAAAQLNALLGRPAETPIPSPVLPPLSLRFPQPDSLLSWAGGTRPLVRQAEAEVERARSMKALAEKEIWPDLTLGVEYGLGRMGGELRSMGGAMVGVTLPVHAGRRQYKAREEAGAWEQAAEAGLVGVMVRVDARIREILAELGQARTLLALHRDEILPQARAVVESALSSYRVGAVDFLTLVESRMALNGFEAEYFGLQASLGTAWAQLESTIGRDLPVTGEVLLEGR